MATAGRRKPRKSVSSKRGARKMPKRVTSQTSDGVRKKSSMGMSLGMAMTDEIAWIAKERMRPRGIRRKALRRAASGLASMPVVKGRLQRRGKTNQETARVRI
jgi:hypothetical protein